MKCYFYKNKEEYEKIAYTSNPYGDGHMSTRIMNNVKMIISISAFSDRMI